MTPLYRGGHLTLDTKFLTLFDTFFDTKMSNVFNNLQELNIFDTRMTLFLTLTCQNGVTLFFFNVFNNLRDLVSPKFSRDTFFDILQCGTLELFRQTIPAPIFGKQVVNFESRLKFSDGCRFRNIERECQIINNLFPAQKRSFFIKTFSQCL